MALHTITEFYAEWFSGCPNIISKPCTKTVFKNFVKQNSDLNKCTYAHDLLVCQTLSKCNGSWVVLRTKYEF
jgi:hypothetical protein